MPRCCRCRTRGSMRRRCARRSRASQTRGPPSASLLASCDRVAASHRASRCSATPRASRPQSTGSRSARSANACSRCRRRRRPRIRSSIPTSSDTPSQRPASPTSTSQSTMRARSGSSPPNPSRHGSPRRGTPIRPRFASASRRRSRRTRSTRSSRTSSALRGRPSGSRRGSSSSRPAGSEEVTDAPRTRHRRGTPFPLPSLQGPSRSPGGAARLVTETGPEQAKSLPRRALVVGLGVTGRAAAFALARHGVAVVAADCSSVADVAGLSEAGVEIHAGSEEESLLEGAELVVKGPGVPNESPLPAAARARGVPLWSEIELGYRLLHGNPLIGVTGTKGKTTTVRLLGAILEAAQRRVVLAGNEHRPLSEVANELGTDVWVVCELSSFALEHVQTLACDVAVLLNLEPDHLYRYESV